MENPKRRNLRIHKLHWSMDLTGVFFVISLPHIFEHDGLRQDYEIEPDSIATAAIYRQGLEESGKKLLIVKKRK